MRKGEEKIVRKNGVLDEIKGQGWKNMPWGRNVSKYESSSRQIKNYPEANG